MGYGIHCYETDKELSPVFTTDILLVEILGFCYEKKRKFFLKIFHKSAELYANV